MSLSRSCTTAALCVLILFATKHSQARPVGMRFDIPFGFYVGDKALPAGSYVVELDMVSGIVALHNRTEFAQLGVSASPALRDGNPGTLNGRLVFYTYGTAHVLKKVWMEGQLRGAFLQSTRAEREMATAQGKAMVEVASK